MAKLTQKQCRGFEKALQLFEIPDAFVEKAIRLAKDAGLQDVPFAEWDAQDRKLLKKALSESGIDPAEIKRKAPRAILLHGSIRSLASLSMGDLESHWRDVLGKTVISAKQSKLEKHIETVCKATGWSHDAAKREMKRVREKTGMPFFRYAANKCWNMDDQQIAELQEKREREEREREQAVMDATGWDLEKAKAEMKAAKALGLTPASYVKHRCWGLDDQQIATLAANIKLGKQVKPRKLTREERIREVSVQAGWSLEEARAAMDQAEAQGVSYRYYCKYRGWELSPEELQSIPGIVADMKAARQRNNEYYFNLALKKSGLSKEELIRDIEEKHEMGFSVMRYAQRSIWKLDDEMIRRSLVTVSAKSNKANKTVMEEFVPKIQAETGWTAGKILLEMEKSRSAFGASGIDYFQYRFWELTPEEQATFLTWGLMQKARVASVDFFEGRDRFDKAGFAKLFGDVMKHDSFMFDPQVPFEDFCKRIEGWTYLFVKPVNASGGTGVCKKRCNESREANREIYDELCKSPQMVVDQCIIQHSKMSSLCSTSVNTVRMVTLNHNGECKFLLTCLRMGVGAEVDNLHSGGLAAEVELETGLVCSDAIDYYGEAHSHHPVTGVKINGFQIPHWDILLETCRKIYDRVEGVELIGWDFAITEDGVDVIEGNTCSGYDAMQMPHRLHHRTGLRAQAFDPYFQV